MSAKKKPARRTPLQRVVLGLYIVAVVLSLVVVVSFVVLQVFFPRPKVDDVVERPVITDYRPSPSPGVTDGPEGPDDTDPPETVTLHRRDGVYTCLLVGNADEGGTDTIMLGVFDVNGKTASLISIPRDTGVYANGKDHKINTLYSMKDGGMDLLKETVTSITGVPVDFYVLVDTYAFKAIVDRLEGVYFDVPPGMDYEDPEQELYIHLTPGYQKLNGDDALKLVRCRSDSAYNGRADIGRVETQRAFLTALVKQALTIYNLDKINDLVNILNFYMTTDMTWNNMVRFATEAFGMDLNKDVASATLGGEWNGRVSYYVLNGEDVLKLVNGLGVYEEEIPLEILNLYRP